MGVKIAFRNDGSQEWVCFEFDSGDKDFLSVTHAEFRAACCRDLGLVDPDANADEFCRRLMADKTQRAAGHAAEVLAAASRRLA